MQTIAGISALLMTLFMIGNGAAVVAALKDPLAAFNDAGYLLSLGAGAVPMFHISMVFDVLAYLSLVPIVFFCWTWLKQHGEGMAGLFAFCGLAYSLLGSAGGVVVDAVMPPLMTGYAAAPAAEQAAMRLAAGAVNQAVAHGIWNPLEVLMVSLWLLGFWLLARREHRWLALLALVAGAIGLLDPVGWIIGSDAVLTVGAFGNALIPVWAAWLGIYLLRRRSLLGAANGSLHAD